jgi:hypothetical protein
MRYLRNIQYKPSKTRLGTGTINLVITIDADTPNETVQILNRLMVPFNNTLLPFKHCLAKGNHPLYDDLTIGAQTL